MRMSCESESMRLVVCLGVIALSGCQRQLPPPTATVAQKMCEAALKQAQDERKGVLLWFAIADSDWCQLMERFHDDPTVREVLNQHLVVVKIDLYQTPGGEQVYLENGNVRGVPAFSILDEAGNLLADSGSQDEASNIGFPTTHEQLTAYTTAMKTGCPAITDAELAILQDTLEAVLDESQLPPAAAK